MRLAAAVLLLAGAAGCARERVRAEGAVTAIAADRRAISIRRDDLPVAPTLTFALDDPARLGGITDGDRVRFAYSQRPGGWWRTLDEVAPLLGRARTHDHRPRHGGVVEMIDRMHVEASATRDGRVRLWLSNLWREPLGHDTATGTVTATAGGREQTLPLHARDDALEATAAPFDGGRVELQAALVVDGRPLHASFTIPLDAAAPGLAGRISKRCRSARGPRTRCVIRFERPPASVAASGRGDVAVVTAADGAPSVWRPSTGELLSGLEAPPPEAGDSGMHAHQAPVATMSGDGRTTFVADGDRVLRYDLADGRLSGTLPLKGGAVQTMASTPDGGALAIAHRFGASAWVYDFGSHRLLRTVPSPREITVASFAADGRRLAIGDEGGHVTVADLDGGGDRTFLGLAQSARGLAFGGGNLVGLARDGLLAVWRADEGTTRLRIDTGLANGQLAVSDDGTLAAVAGTQSVQVYALADGRLVDTIDTPSARIAGIALSGPATLLLTDARGRLSIRDLR